MIKSNNENSLKFIVVSKQYITGRLTAPSDKLAREFGASVSFDKRLAEYDIRGSVAHAAMLAECNIITYQEKEKITNGLEQILGEIKAGDFVWLPELEDVHMNIESALVAKIGEVGKKLHTGRSRNDQVATDLRLWLRARIDDISTQITQLQKVLLAIAANETDTIMPGYTHLQVAQPISFSFHMLAWFEMLDRDLARLKDCRKRVNIMPLGCAALAGTTFPINRRLTCKLLEFDQPAANALDAVSDRDFAIEFNAACALIMTHLSRFSEEIILWSSSRFDFVELSDSYCTGSSIMPQKKNPDIPELIRGKTGRVTGNLVNLLTVMKAQPLAYNKDNQEDKEPLFDSADTVLNSLILYTGMMENISLKPENMRAAALQGYATATDLADYLVKKGLAFRDAHDIVGKAVASAIRQNSGLEQLPLTALQQFAGEISEDVYEILSLHGSVNSRMHYGATAGKTVTARIQELKNRG